MRGRVVSFRQGHLPHGPTALGVSPENRPPHARREVPMTACFGRDCRMAIPAFVRSTEGSRASPLFTG